MKLTATPFDAQTGELLPVYRDAYLRGDLARSSAQAVEDYLRRDAGEAYSVVTRWHHLQADENPAAAPTWVGRQLQSMREQPQRFRRRAMSFVMMGALVAGASMAANLPASKLPASKLPATNLSASATSLSMATMAAAPEAMAPEAALARTVVLHGRILNEKGLPLAGATVLQKGTSYGTSTDANGNYSLRVAASSQATLQYGYGGYTEQEVKAANAATTAVVLQPKEGKRKHWLFF
ncbi:carboxypeptidase-like regulatory domain-containing protein [Hymenobacter bucti]|uniref:Carboxypeptidase-like regulatory domain-containing protein n=1 Tax=Hymenobacter bucti TaxID=1844114 RepID=A0ABW4QN73_9BACT